MIIEVIHICIHLQSHPFKEIHSYYWLFLKILSSHWLRRVDFFKWITLKVDVNVNYFYLSFYWVHAFFENLSLSPLPQLSALWSFNSLTLIGCMLSQKQLDQILCSLSFVLRLTKD